MADTITREELKRKIEAGEDFLLIDVLLADSYAREHLPGAINLPLHDIGDATTASIPKDREVIVYCGSFACQASPAAAAKLREMGFTRVLDFEGGLADWKDAGYPMERAEAAKR